MGADKTVKECRVREWLWVFVPIVSIGGIWYPKLGYFLLLVFLTLILSSFFSGRWFCGNLCPRGSFNDLVVSKISKNRRIPDVFRNMWFRGVAFFGLMGFMVLRIISASGLVDKIGMVFVTMCIMTTLASTLLGLFVSPRAWCAFCPMGTLQRLFGGSRFQVTVDRDLCVDCGLCMKACPMQLDVRGDMVKKDCIKCRKCVRACPKKAVSL